MSAKQGTKKFNNLGIKSVRAQPYHHCCCEFESTAGQYVEFSMYPMY